jgi:hypothetical protein
MGGIAAAGSALAAVLALAGSAEAKDMTYRARVDVRPSKDSAVCGQRELGEAPCFATGKVFIDRDRDGRLGADEAGVAGVSVSNGREVVRTDEDGAYRLPVFEQPGGTTLFITKPAAFDVPLDALNVPQFSYHHIPNGSPSLRFGGLPASGPLPRAINFPLVPSHQDEHFKAIISGDTQPYSNNEVGYVRDTLVRDMIADGTDKIEFLIIEGDILGDDLGLYPRLKEVLQPTNVPIYWVPGNHDLDADAPSDAHSFDTFRREWGPAYYSFDVGRVHFVVLDDVRYPCTSADNADGLHAFCEETDPAYTGALISEHVEWLANDLSVVSKDKLVVLNMHIPLISYIDNTSAQHQVYNTAEIYQLLEGRPSLALSGHTHTLEQIRPGELFEGWQTAFTEPLGPSPMPQIVTGATCGAWWSGDFDDQGIPQAWDRVGSPRGHLVFEFDGNRYRDRFRATGKPRERQMSLSFLSPTFTAWYDALASWLAAPAETRPALTPVGINDLPDPSIITASDLAGGTDLVVNVWNGSKDSSVFVEFDRSGQHLPLERVQPGNGESFVEYLDPFALERQLFVLRYAVRSGSGNARARGYELFRGSQFTADPQPTTTGLTTHSNHVWRIPLPDLGAGAHTARVRTVDAHGQSWQDVIAFEIRTERPPAFFRSEIFE